MRKNSKFLPCRQAGKIQSSKFKIGKSRLFKVILIVIFVYIIFLISRDLYASAFFQKKDRINLVISQDQIAVYSLGLSDKVNYFIPFYPDLDVIVPGGYGYYRLGALAKLVSLEKNPDLFRKSYTLITSSFVDFYFYPSLPSDKIEVIFGKEKRDFFLQRFYLIFFGKSNARFFDRLFLYLQFLGKTKGQFKIIGDLPTKIEGSRRVFSPNNFFETYQGLFYKKTYRSEQLNVQIVYTKSYKTAQFLTQILEGEGIRVVDLSQSDNKEKNCFVFEDKKKFSETAKSVSQFFACRLSVGKTGAYDIILKLGGVEEEWEVE